MIKMLFIDMSRTLVKGSGANSGAAFLGKGDTYRTLYPKYQSGEIGMEELLTSTYYCWKGLKTEDLPKVYAKFEFNPNVKNTIKQIKAKEIKTTLLTNIPKQLALLFKEELGFDFVGGSLLEVKEGVFTGKVLEFAHDKVTEALKVLNQQNIEPHEAISVGDRKDDAEVFKKVKFGISYNGDDAANKASKYQITDFRELLTIIESTD